jgi:predicted Zn-dependent peptidase
MKKIILGLIMSSFALYAKGQDIPVEQPNKAIIPIKIQREKFALNDILDKYSEQITKKVEAFNQQHPFEEKNKPLVLFKGNLNEADNYFIIMKEKKLLIFVGDVPKDFDDYSKWTSSYGHFGDFNSHQGYEIIYVCTDPKHSPKHTALTQEAMSDTIKKYHCISSKIKIF